MTPDFHYTKTLIRWRWLFLALTVMVTALLGLGLSRLQFATDYKIFFKKDNPHLLALERLEKIFAKSDNVLIALQPESGDIFSSERLSAIQELTRLAWKTPYTLRVDSLTNFQHIHGGHDTLLVRDLVPTPPPKDPSRLQRIKQIALDEPLLVNWLVSPDGLIAGVNITVQLPEKNLQQAVPEVARYVRALIRDFQRRHPEFHIYLSGGVMMNNAFPEVSQRDLAALTPIMYGVILIGLGILFGSTAHAIICLLIFLLSSVGSLGLAGWLGIPLSPPSASAPHIILTIAIADCVHFLSSYHQYTRLWWLTPKDRKPIMADAIQASLNINLRPMFLTSLTTCIGFLSLNFSESPPFRDLGNIVAAGSAFAFILTTILVPVLVSWFPGGIQPRTQATYTFFPKLSAWINQPGIHRRILGGFGILVIASLMLLPRNNLDDNPLDYFSQDNKFRLQTEFITDHLTGVYGYDYLVNSGRQNGVTEPVFLDNIVRFVTWLRKQPEVIHVYSITDILQKLNMSMNDNNPDYYAIPSDRELVSQFLFLYEFSLPMGMDLNDRLDIDKSATVITVRIKNLSSKQILELEQRAQEWIEDNLPKNHGISPGVGGNIIFAHIGMTNIHSMVQGSLTAFALIALVLIVALRSFRLGLLSLIPNLIPTAMAFGLWALLDGTINVGVAAVMGLTLGIVVDDTVHFLSKYQRARQHLSLGIAEAITYTLEHVGPAIVITSLVLIAGFSILVLSEFAINAKMGLLTAITVAFALLADCLFLPALLQIHQKQG